MQVSGESLNFEPDDRLDMVAIRGSSLYNGAGHQEPRHCRRVGTYLFRKASFCIHSDSASTASPGSALARSRWRSRESRFAATNETCGGGAAAAGPHETKAIRSARDRGACDRSPRASPKLCSTSQTWHCGLKFGQSFELIRRDRVINHECSA